MEEKNSGFSLNRRLLRALRRRARGEGGVTLVEMMVSLFIFAIVSTMFTVSIVQYLHSTTADAIRTRSATEIATSVQALDRYVRNAEGVEEAASGDRLPLVTIDADGIRQCAVIEYTEATWSGGRVDDYGSVVVKTRQYATGAGGAWSEHAVLTAVMNNSTASTSDDSLFKNKLFSMDGGTRAPRPPPPTNLYVDGGTRVGRYSPVTGSYVGGKPVTSNTLTSFTARNVGSSASVDFSQCR